MVSMATRPNPEQIFLFVNPTSGGNRGEAFMKVPQPFFVQLDDASGCRQVQLNIFSLLDGKSGNKPGFHKLREVVASNRGNPVRVIVGGGDGTIMWADGEVEKHGVSSAQVKYGIVPLGTGNDFSRVAGWGGKNPSKIDDRKGDYTELRNLVSKWATASSRPHDVWEVLLKVEDEEGAILKVDSSKNEVPLEGGNVKQKAFTMINYFSIGQESKVGIEFDKNRTKSQMCNLFVYAWQGVVAEMQCWSAQLINNLVDKLHVGNDATGRIVLDNDGEDDIPRMIGDPESLMFLNVNSYAGGNAQLWQKDAQVGVAPAPSANEIDLNSDPGDGRLEVVTLPSISNIALDKLSHQARRVHSGGPYHLQFVQDEEDPNDTYCQVDGEFFHLLNPEYARIKLKKKLQVLQYTGQVQEAESDDEVQF